MSNIPIDQMSTKELQEELKHQKEELKYQQRRKKELDVDNKVKKERKKQREALDLFRN